MSSISVKGKKSNENFQSIQSPSSIWNESKKKILSVKGKTSNENFQSIQSPSSIWNESKKISKYENPVEYFKDFEKKLKKKFSR